MRMMMMSATDAMDDDDEQQHLGLGYGIIYHKTPDLKAEGPSPKPSLGEPHLGRE